MRQISFQIEETKACAICHSKAHKGYLTAAALKEHKCCEKECQYLQKLEHDYWKQQERKRLEKKTIKLLGVQNKTWTKNDCYKKVKLMTIENLREFVEMYSEKGEQHD